MAVGFSRSICVSPRLERSSATGPIRSDPIPDPVLNRTVLSLRIKFSLRHARPSVAAADDRSRLHCFGTPSRYSFPLSLQLLPFRFPIGLNHHRCICGWARALASIAMKPGR